MSKENVEMNPASKASVVKRFVMWLVCYGFFWCGHVWSRAVLRFDCMAWTCSVYNNLMSWSVIVNDKYNFDVWSDT